MTRYEAIEKALREARKQFGFAPRSLGYEYTILRQIDAALALPEDGKTVNVGDDGWPKLDKPARVGNTTFAQRVSSRLVVECAQRAYEYKLREASGEPMPYRVVRDGDKVRFI